jgi:hypothetical protein
VGDSEDHVLTDLALGHAALACLLGMGMVVLFEALVMLERGESLGWLQSKLLEPSGAGALLRAFAVCFALVVLVRFRRDADVPGSDRGYSISDCGDADDG